jgi:hypothetical protein
VTNRAYAISGMPLALFGTLLIFCNGCYKAGAAFHSDDEVGKWINQYYLKPEPNRVPAAFIYMGNAGTLDDKDGAVSPMFAFLAGAMSVNPDKAASWIDSMSGMKEKNLEVVVMGVAFSGLADSKSLEERLVSKHPTLTSSVTQYFDGNPRTVLDISTKNGPAVLDGLWANFMATGSDLPVIKIIEALKWVEAKGDMYLILVGGAAKWSLTSNAVQHKRVLEICEQQMKVQPAEISMQLKIVVEDARRQLAEKNSAQH